MEKWDKEMTNPQPFKTTEEILDEIEKRMSPTIFFELNNDIKFETDSDTVQNINKIVRNDLPRLLAAFRVLWEANEFYGDQNNWSFDIDLSASIFNSDINWRKNEINNY